MISFLDVPYNSNKILKYDFSRVKEVLNGNFDIWDVTMEHNLSSAWEEGKLELSKKIIIAEFHKSFELGTILL